MFPSPFFQDFAMWCSCSSSPAACYLSNSQYAPVFHHSSAGEDERLLHGLVYYSTLRFFFLLVASLLLLHCLPLYAFVLLNPVVT